MPDTPDPYPYYEGRPDMAGARHDPRPPPIGFVTLQDAEKIVGGDDPALRIATGCAAGEIEAVYETIEGVADLDRRVWLAHWRSYFAKGTIWRDLPRLHGGRPTGELVRCERAIFIRRDTLPPPPLTHTNLRHPSDEPLIQEGLQALANGKAKNPLQAAKLVYLKAAGPSEQANLERLRKLIAAEQETRSPKIANSSPKT